MRRKGNRWLRLVYESGGVSRVPHLGEIKKVLIKLVHDLDCSALIEASYRLHCSCWCYV